MADLPDADLLNTIFHDCRRCGTCCRTYRKVPLEPVEVDRIERLGGHVGVALSMKTIREKGLAQARHEARSEGRLYMIHPDDRGCVFLERRDGRYSCRIYHYRPKACRGFRCNLADDSFLTLFGDGATCLLGQNDYGLPHKG